jgi:hypothetical protein
MLKVGKPYQVVFFTFLLSGFVTTAISAQEQLLEKRFSFIFSNTPYEAVVDSLRHKVKCGFSYSPDIFPEKRRFSAVFLNQKLSALLDSLLNPLSFTYKVVGNNVVFLKKEIALRESAGLSSVEQADTMKVLKLSGKVISCQDKKPIEFTSIYIRNRNIGTMSNIDGNFTIKVPKSSFTDSVYFSCIGYKPVHVMVGDFRPDGNIITLEISNIQLKEVKVKPIDPKEILRKTLEGIRSNYSNHPLNLIAFYREVLRQDHQYVGLSEAVLNIYKASYNNFANDQVSIYKGRRTRFNKQMDTVLFKFQGGISTSLMLDIAKNPSNFITDEYMVFYDFTLDEIVNVDGRYTYVLAFDQTDACPYPLYKGKLYIDIESYALVRADFAISPKAIDKASDLLVQKSSRKLKVKPTFSSYIVNYTRLNSTWYLNYIREEVEFKVKRKYSLYSTSFHLKAEMLVTQTDSVNVRRIKFDKQVRYSDIFVDKIGKYDPEFWGSFNILQPDESLEEAIEKIRTKLSSKSN